MGTTCRSSTADAYVRDQDDAYVRDQDDAYVNDQDDAYVRDQDDANVRDQDDANVKDQDDAYVKDQDDANVKDQDDAYVRDQDDANVKDQDDAYVRDQDDANVKDQDDAYVKDQYDANVKDQDDANVKDQDNATCPCRSRGEKRAAEGVGEKRESPHTNMTSTTVVVSSAAAVSLATCVMNIILVIWGSVEPPKSADNSSLLTHPSYAGWPMSKSVVVITENQTYIVDPATAKHSFIDLEKVLFSSLDRYKNETAGQLHLMTNMIDNLSEACAQNVSDIHRILTEFIVNVTTWKGAENNRLQSLNVTMLVLTNRTRLLEVNQTLLLEALSQTSDKLGQVSDRLNTVEDEQKVAGETARLAYSRSLQAIQTSDVPWSTFVSLLLGVLALDVPVLLCVSWWLVAGRESDKTQSPGDSPSGSPRGSHPASNGLTERIKPLPGRPGRLLSGVSIVGFDTTSLGAYSSQVESVVGPLGQRVQRVLVGNPDDLATSEICQTAVVIVPFNERNVILEEPHLLQGEAKVKVVRQLINRGVDVFVMYCGDLDSATLPPGTLYNPLLTSVKSHSTLSALNTTGRVLSIHNRMNSHQMAHLRQSVSHKSGST